MICDTNAILSGSISPVGVITGQTVTGTNTSVQFQLIEADDAALSVNVQVIVQTDAIPLASLVAGAMVPLHWDRVDPYTPRRFVGLRFVLAGAVASGAYFAAIVTSLQDPQVNVGGGFKVL